MVLFSLLRWLQPDVCAGDSVRHAGKKLASNTSHCADQPRTKTCIPVPRFGRSQTKSSGSQPNNVTDKDHLHRKGVENYFSNNSTSSGFVREESRNSNFIEKLLCTTTNIDSLVFACQDGVSCHIQIYWPSAG